MVHSQSSAVFEDSASRLNGNKKEKSLGCVSTIKHHKCTSEQKLARETPLLVGHGTTAGFAVGGTGGGAFTANVA
jgi:hypothetical protein